MSNTVIVSESARGVHTITVDEPFKPREIGTLVSRIYEGESVQRHFFLAGVNHEDYNGDDSIMAAEKVYRLGPTTTEWKFVDHPETLMPLLNQGYSLSKIFYGRGGLTMSAILNPPDYQIQPDSVSWDRTFWDRIRPEVVSQTNLGIIEAMMVSSSIKPKKAINFLRGWFRLICTNGLMGNVFTWPRLRMNHNYFDPSRIEEYAGSYASGGSAQMDPGPFIGTGRGLDYLQSWLQNYVVTHSAVQENEDDDLDEDEVTTTETSDLFAAYSIDESETPLSVRKSLDPINRMSSWYAQSLSEQFEMMANGIGTAGKIYAVDMMNALTNPLYARNLQDPEFSPIRLMSKTESLFNAFSSLVGAFSLI